MTTRVADGPAEVARRGPPRSSRARRSAQAGAARWLPRVGAAAAGTLPAIAFPEVGSWPLAAVGLVPLLLIVRAAGSLREGAARGWLGGAGFLAATHSWLLPATGPFLLPVVLALGLLWLPFGAAAQMLLRPARPFGAALAVLVLPAIWLLIEYVRSWERLGGPFGLLGASQSTGPLAPLIPLGGIWAASAAAVAVATALTLLIAGPGLRVRLSAAALAVAVAGLGPAYAALVELPDATGVTTRVAVVQPGLLRGVEARFAAGLAAARSLAGRDVDLVVWGESSVGLDLDGRPDLRAQLEATVAELGADILVGTDARRGRGAGIVKSAVLITPTGVAGRYDKQRLVPFGEYVPLRPALGWLARLTPVAGEDRLRGSGPELLETRSLVLGPLVCFESAFPDMSRHLARSGAELLVVQSSTSTFQDSAAPEQHAALAGVRARETGLPVVHATLTGTSAVYAPDGQLLGQLGTDRRGTLVVDVPLNRGSTPYAAVGDVVPRAAVLFLLVWVAVTVTGMLARTSPAASSRS